MPEPVKRRRNRDLLGVQQEVSLAGNRELLGRTLELLVEGRSPRSRSPENRPASSGQVQMVGRTRTDHILVVDAPDDLAGS